MDIYQKQKGSKPNSQMWSFFILPKTIYEKNDIQAQPGKEWPVNYTDNKRFINAIFYSLAYKLWAL